MKFDKETIAAFVVCVAVLLLWTPFCRMMGWMPEEKKPVVSEQTAVVDKKAGSDAGQKKSELKPAAAAQLKTPQEAASRVSNSKLLNIPFQSIANNNIKMTFSPAEGDCKQVVFKNYFKADRKTAISLKNGISPGALEVFGKKQWKVIAVVDNSKTGNDSYRLVRKMATVSGQEFFLSQEWKIIDDFMADYKVTVKNISGKPLEFEDFSMLGNPVPPMAQLSNDQIRRETHSVDYLTTDSSFGDISIDGKQSKFDYQPDAKIKWSAVTNKYFTAILVPAKPFDKLVKKRIERQDKDQKGYFVGASGGLYSQVSIQPGKEVSFSGKYYCGPKVISELKKVDSSASKLMHLAWGPLDWIARIMLNALVWLKSFCGSYGWSIIIITIIVRLIFWPITQKANSSMKKMQTLQPKIKELREKYKDDSQVMNAKVMELYRQEKVNPLGGCLPILLQIPVFIALYQTLDGAVELRQVPFWWAADLAKPDTVAVLFGLPINPLILAMVGLMVVQQRLTPSAMDPMQQKMMLLMPVVMLFFLYSLPSGLTLYWTVSQILSIVQLLVQQKLTSGEKTKNIKKTA
ncbi:membrane protein insertase YidC [Lentisphaerota bacterium ZTH]|nr:membrane protein insertase YidC [Lentisphaerota bacterium]WET06828.1 membrane protein insertase YidC [Lentisphaerota bacterium ZTH]